QQAGIQGADALAREVPGLSQRYASPGLTEFEARGLASNGGASPTVGFYLDEVPLSPPALSQSGKVVIDPNLYDVNRIEVLRGPQGTLYGSGSMGGTIKIVTNQPQLNTFEGSAQVTGSYTEGGHGNGAGNVMLNIPLGDVFALRVVAGDAYRSGWINEVVLNPFPLFDWNKQTILSAPVQSVIPDVNSMRLYGGRVSLLFKPNDDLSVTAMAFTQTLEMGGYDLFDSPPGTPYENHYEGFPLTEPINDKSEVFALTVVANLQFAQLTSATSYFERVAEQVQDASESIYLSNGGPAGPPFVPIPYYEWDPSHQISQEIRLASTGNGPLQWVAGGFYSLLTSAWNEQSSNPTIGAYNPDDVYFQSNNPYHLKQWALFADGTYKITDAWKLAVGARYYSYDSNIGEKEWGYDGLTPTEPATFKVTEQSNRGGNPRVNLSYEPTSDLNTYVTAARGFRPGGANIYFPPYSEPPHCLPGTPIQFGPDSVWNYEVGEKARLFDNWLQINSDFYYINWKGVQQSVLLLCGYEANVNAGNGHSYGPEVEVNAKLSPNWSVSANGTYTDARITSPTALYKSLIFAGPGLSYCGGATNCTTPILNVPRTGAGLTLIYTTPIGPDYKFIARLADTFVGPSTDEAYFFGLSLPSYNLVNTRFTLAHDPWSANFFVDNLANKIAIVSANNTSFQFNIPEVIRYSTVQPRTFGMQLNYKF
ncbi:MAG TPA: TonB-dependent receptor, partial [Steroidobacteraceae bacterium]|nr:TonB-dependent receptor [Steroidobacteraceae bacterium]